MIALTYKLPRKADGMDDQDSIDLQLIELALQNPAPGTLAARVFRELAAQAREHDEKRFPTATHAATGALCFCAVHCEGAHCHCWCHREEAL